MIDEPLTWAVVVVVLTAFAYLGLRGGADRDLEGFALAGRSESGRSIGLSFVASGVGAWMLVAPAEVGYTAGAAGVLGYGLAVAAPLVALALLGKRLRVVLPDGRSLADFARRRYGRGMQVTVALITLLYMGVAVAAELTAASGILARLTGVEPRLLVGTIVVTTLAYTAYGGLRASLRTDAWQAWLLVGLVATAGVLLLARVPEPAGAVAAASGDGWTLSGLEAATTLVLAVLVTTLFHNGMWQRVWAARDEGALRRGALLGVVGRVPLVVAAGMVGVLAVGLAADVGDPPTPVFALLGDLPAWVAVLLLVMLVALVASSIDTLENGMASLVATELPGVGLRGARVATVVAMLPALLAALQGWSVLRLLLIADLLCAAAAAPALLGLWRRATTRAAVVGTLGGLLGAYGHGWAASGDMLAAVGVATFAEGLALPPFLAALGGSAAMVVAVSLAWPDSSYRSAGAGEDHTSVGTGPSRAHEEEGTS